MSMSAPRVLSAIALLTAIGCGGDDETGPTGSIQLSASPSALTVQQGGTGTVTVTLVRGGGFADPVNVAVTGLPSGVTLSVNPAQLTGTTTTAVVTVNVASTVAPGSYPATVTATATGIGSATASYTLTVTAAPTPNYALTATPAAVTASAGGTTTTTIGITRTAFTGAVALTLDSPPAGVTGAFNPASATADQSVLTISVASTVTPGNYNVTVKGSATGPGDKTVVVALTVTGPPPPANYTLAASAVTINAGATGQSTVTITRTNFTGAVTLSLDAPPAGITATFNPAAPTGTTSDATITVASTVTPGSYNVTIKGTATGIADKTTTVAVTVAAAANFTLAASPTALTLAPGASGNSTVTIVRTNLTADIALSLATPPAGITGVFTPPTLTGANLTSTLALTVAANVQPGVYPVTVQGVGGSLTKTAVVTVTVAAGANVVLTTTPTSINVAQGSSGSVTLNAARTNFTGNITPTLTGTAGITATFNPNPLTGTTSAVTVNVASGVAVGAHVMTITGATGGLAGTPTTTFTVNVTAPTSGGSIVYEFCNSDDVPLKFWRLSGSTWSEVSPTVVGTVTRFSFDISGTTGGIAYTVSNTGAFFQTSMKTTGQRALRRGFTKLARQKVTSGLRLANQEVSLTSPYFDTFVMFALTTEINTNRAICVPTTTPTLITKTFNVSGIGAGESGVLGYGGATTLLSPATPSNTVNVQAGSYDWLAVFGTQGGLPDFASNWTAYRLGRNEATPGPAVAVNRVGASAFTTLPFTISGGAANSFWAISEAFSGSRGAITGFPVGSFTSSSGNAYFLAPADRLATDMVTLQILNADQNQTDARFQLRYLGSAPPASGAFTMSQAVPAFVVSPVTGGWSVTGQIPTDYQTAASFISVEFEGASALYTINATRGWLTANASSTSYTLTSPTLPGFLAAWTPGAPLASSTVLMFGFDFQAVPVAGTVQSFAYRTQ